VRRKKSGKRPSEFVSKGTGDVFIVGGGKERGGNGVEIVKGVRKRKNGVKEEDNGEGPLSLRPPSENKRCLFAKTTGGL